MSTRLIDVCPTPRFIVWDITYACPLRCSHCYSESGRRASRQLTTNDLYRVTDALVSTSPRAIVLSGGEPLVVKEIFDVATRMVEAGVEDRLHLALATEQGCQQKAFRFWRCPPSAGRSNPP